MAEVTECTAADRDEFWQDTPQDVTGATETGEQAGKARGCGCSCHRPAGGLRVAGAVSYPFIAPRAYVGDETLPIIERKLRAYLAAAKDEQEEK